MRILLIAALTIWFGGLVPPSSARAQATKIFYTEFQGQRLWSAQPDGSVPTVLFSGLGQWSGVAVDSIHGLVYWANSQGNAIQRATVTGQQLQTVVSTPLGYPRSVAIDAAGGRVYWGEQDGRRLRSANVDGSDVRDVLASENYPFGIALDLGARELYWTNLVSKQIGKVGLDGSNPQVVLTLASAPFGIALDGAAGKLYWTQCSTNTAHRSNLDGSSQEVFATGPCPQGVAVDHAGGAFYVLNTGTGLNAGSIQRFGLSGSPSTTLTGGLNSPFGIAVQTAAPQAVPGVPPFALLLLALGTLLVGVAARARRASPT